MFRTVPEKESLTVEFKSDRRKHTDGEIFEEVVAFANTDGGDLFLGVEDDGTITGVHKDHMNPITLSAYIANNTIPPIPTRCEIIDEVKPVLRISVPKLQGSIAATCSGKILRRRIAANNMPENVPMYPTEIATRLSDLRLLDYSAMVVSESAVSDLDPLEIERLRRIILAYSGEKMLLELNDEEVLKALGFIREENGIQHPTIGGILMVGKVSAIKRFIPTGMSAFQVLEGTQVRVNEDYTLPILAAIEKIISHIDAWNPEHELEFGLFRMSIPEFDHRAIREAIVNAFSHRDYSKMGRVRVAIDDNGLIVANPGSFIEGISIQNLLTAEPHGRNPLLADALKRVGLAEKTGRGIDRIFEGSLQYGRPLPDYSQSSSATVSLFIPRSKPDIELVRIIADEQNRIGRPMPLNALFVLNTLKDIPRSSVSQIAEAAHLPETSVKIVLDKMIENGMVEAYGGGRGRNYMLSHNLYHSDKERLIGYVQQRDIDEARYPEMILSMAKEHQFIARADVVNLLHVGDAKAYRLLKGLVDRGQLVLVDKGKHARYKIKDANP